MENFEYVEVPDDHIVHVPISGGLLADMVRVGYSVDHLEIVEGIPMTAEFVGLHCDDRNIYLAFRHHTFDAVPDGHVIPHVAAVFARRRCRIEHPRVENPEKTHV